MAIEGIQVPGEGASPLREPAAVRPVGEGGPNPRTAISLEPGQEVEARLVARITADRFLLDVSGQPFEAVINGGLPDGSPIRLRVAQAEPQLVLEPLPSAASDEAELASLVRAHLDESLFTPESLGNLQQVLGQLTAGDSPLASLPSVAQLHAFLQGFMAPGAALTAEGVTHLIQDGGTFYEAKLARLAQENAPVPARLADTDLKGLLLQVQRDLTAAAQPGRRAAAEPAPVAGPGPRPDQPGAPTPTHPNLVNLINQQLNRLETQQALNLLAQWHDAPFQVQIPLTLGQEAATIHLAIEADARGDQAEAEGRPGGYNLLFQLDLEGFGRTRIDAWVGARALRVNFFVEQEQAAGQMRAELPALRQTFQSLGFGEVLLAAEPLGRMPPEKRQRFDDVRLGIPAAVHLLDVKV